MALGTIVMKIEKTKLDDLTFFNNCEKATLIFVPLNAFETSKNELKFVRGKVISREWKRKKSRDVDKKEYLSESKREWCWGVGERNQILNINSLFLDCEDMKTDVSVLGSD